MHLVSKSLHDIFSRILLPVRMVIVEDREQRNVEDKDAGQDRVFENLHKRDAVSCADDEVCDQADDDDEVRKQDQACGDVRSRLRLAAIFSVTFQIEEKKNAEHDEGKRKGQDHIRGMAVNGVLYAQIDNAFDKRNDKYIKRAHKQCFAFIENIARWLSRGGAVACSVGGSHANTVAFGPFFYIIKLDVACGRSVSILCAPLRRYIFLSQFFGRLFLDDGLLYGRLRLGAGCVFGHGIGEKFVFFLFSACIVVQSGKKVFIISLRRRTIGV